VEGSELRGTVSVGKSLDEYSSHYSTDVCHRYVRLFLRKTAAWHRINRLGYYGDIADLPAAAEDLLDPRSLPAVAAPAQINPGEREAPQDTILGDNFTFADSSENHIDTLEVASSLLKLDELKALAKEAKVLVQGKNKSDLLKALHKRSQGQGGIGWGSLRRSETEESSKSEHGQMDDEVYLDGKEELDGRNVNRDSHFVRKILASTGPCIRLSAPALRLFERVHLVFYRSTEWTEKSLTTIILARISRRNFPDYVVSRSTNIFATRSDLLEFEASIRTQFRIDFILEFNGTVRKDGLQTVKDTFEDVYPRWKVILAEEQRKEDRVYESGEGAYLRRFSPAWVYTRIVHKGTYVLGRFKEHLRERQMLTELLDQHLFHAARRGGWYQRKALLEEHYMWALKPDDGRSEDAQKKHWKRVALQTCEDGLQDTECHLIYHYDLQKRVMKLEKSLKIVKREQHDFGHVRLAKPLERTVEGIRIEKENTPSRNGNRRDSEPAAPRRGGKTIWVDEREGGGECSVEAMCLSWYRDQGWKGYHSEGGIVRTLFGYLFYDVLFTYIPNVFQTPYQTCPLDLHTDAFYLSRASEINHRLVEIANGDASKLLQEVYDREQEKQTCIVGIDWSYDIDDLQEIVLCFKDEALATVCKVMAQEYQQRGGGIPDLFLWHPENGEVMFSEVKSENDRLSDTQRLWIHVLTGAGIKVELCNAAAREVRTQR
jgi:Fanconi-associated nuclease 1